MNYFGINLDNNVDKPVFKLVPVCSSNIDVKKDFNSLQEAIDCFDGMFISNNAKINFNMPKEKIDITDNPINICHPQAKHFHINGFKTNKQRIITCDDLTSDIQKDETFLSSIYGTQFINRTGPVFNVTTAATFNDFVMFGGYHEKAGDAIDMSGFNVPSAQHVVCNNVGSCGFFHGFDLKNQSSLKSSRAGSQIFIIHSFDSGVSVFNGSFRALHNFLAHRTGRNALVANRLGFIEAQKAVFNQCCLDGISADMRGIASSVIEAKNFKSKNSLGRVGQFFNNATGVLDGGTIKNPANEAFYAGDSSSITLGVSKSRFANIDMGGNNPLALCAEDTSSIVAVGATINGAVTSRDQSYINLRNSVNVNNSPWVAQNKSIIET
jgi:hypothetical protein